MPGIGKTVYASIAASALGAKLTGGNSQDAVILAALGYIANHLSHREENSNENDSFGKPRWREVFRSGLGLLGAGAGALVGGMLVGVPTGVSQIVGGIILAKSLYGWGTNWYGMTRAFSSDASYDIPAGYQTLPRAVATSAFGSSDAARGIADASELALDFAGGRVMFSFAKGPGYTMLPGYGNVDSSIWITDQVGVSALLSTNQNLSVGFMQGVQTGLYSVDAYNGVGRK